MTTVKQQRGDKTRGNVLEHKKVGLCDVTAPPLLIYEQH